MDCSGDEKGGEVLHKCSGKGCTRSGDGVIYDRALGVWLCHSCWSKFPPSRPPKR